MSKFEKLSALNNIANDCVNDGDFVLASRFHDQFMKIAQKMPQGDAGSILRMEVARGLGMTPDVSNEMLLAAIIRVCDYIRPERLRDPSQPASPNNVMLRSMAGATPQNSYADEYWEACTNLFQTVQEQSSTMLSNFKSKADFLRKAARAGKIDMVLAQFASA